MIAKIAVSAATFAIDKPYSYRIPDGMELLPGQRVQLPFGRGNRRSEGVVLSVEAGDETKLKCVERVLDESPILTRNQLLLAAFIRERYFCTLYEAVRAMLPAGLWFQSRASYRLTDDRSWENASIKKPGAAELLRLMDSLGGQAEEPALRTCVADEEILEAALTYLVKKKWVEARTEFQRRLGDKTEKIVTLAASPEEAMAYAAARPKSAQQQKAVLELLCSLGSVAAKEICYFTGAKMPTLQALEKKGYVTLSERPVLRCREIKPANIQRPLVLNDAQEHCFEGMKNQMESACPGIALLYGVTGSGKTSVYIRLIQECLDQGKSAMLLVPEISLTPQLLGLLAAWFGDRVAVLHSSLGVGERYDQWKRVKNGEATVVVGTRSAVFAPCENLGVLILDEEQEHSYKSENSPRYDAREIAIWRGNREKALVVLGSATPSVESMYRAKSGLYRLYTLKERYNGKPLPKVEIVDLREEMKMGNDLSLSYPLREAIHDNVRADKQTILLLNRRGNSRALVCVDCRETPNCPRCDVRLTYHSANSRLMCHYCGHSQPAPSRCSCGGPLKPIGTGTQKVQQELLELFPDMPSLRMDADTVSAVNTHEKILETFEAERIPVLIGTQMVAKGLNLPDVTLVGVLDADLSLYTGGFRAGETTFNMLTQVVGRAGRGDCEGRAIVQTLVPNHQVIRLAAEQNYDGFYELEVNLRRVQNAPPFGDVAIVTFTGQEETAVLRGAAKFRDSLNACLKQAPYTEEKCTTLGPAPCVVPKINYNFRYRLTLRCRMTKSMRFLLAHLLREFARDGQNRGVSAYIDVNGFDA